jgi:hypothetical protein
MWVWVRLATADPVGRNCHLKQRRYKTLRLLNYQGLFYKKFMVDPARSHRSSLSSRVALAAALLLAGSFGLFATFLVPTKTQSFQRKVPAAGEPSGGLIAAKPAKETEASQDLVSFCSEHVTANRSFVIFRNGTCVVVNEPSVDPIGDAKQRLFACEDPEARFVPELTAEGNLMISFKEPVFHNFTAEERAQLEESLSQLTPALLTPKERVSAGDDWVPPIHARFGLLARRRMLEDAASPAAIKVIRAKGRTTAQN